MQAAGAQPLTIHQELYNVQYLFSFFYFENLRWQTYLQSDNKLRHAHTILLCEIKDLLHRSQIMSRRLMFTS